MKISFQSKHERRVFQNFYKLTFPCHPEDKVRRNSFLIFWLEKKNMRFFASLRMTIWIFGTSSTWECCENFCKFNFLVYSWGCKIEGFPLLKKVARKQRQFMNFPYSKWARGKKRFFARLQNDADFCKHSHR